MALTANVSLRARKERLSAAFKEQNKYVFGEFHVCHADGIGFFTKSSSKSSTDMGL